MSLDAQAGSVISQASRVVCEQVCADVQCLHWLLIASSSPLQASVVALLVDVQSCFYECVCRLTHAQGLDACEHWMC